MVGGATGEAGPLVQQRAAMVPRQGQGHVTSLHLLPGGMSCQGQTNHTRTCNIKTCPGESSLII